MSVLVLRWMMKMMLKMMGMISNDLGMSRRDSMAIFHKNLVANSLADIVEVFKVFLLGKEAEVSVHVCCPD